MRRRFLLACVCLCLTGAACTDGTDGRWPSLPTAPTPPTAGPALRPAPPSFPTNLPSITVGEVVRFRVTEEDWGCTGAAGRCRSYNITAPSDGLMSIAITSPGDDVGFLTLLDLYVVPGADNWEVGPGPQIGARVAVRAGSTYEIRIYSAVVPSVELDLRTSLVPR